MQLVLELLKKIFIALQGVYTKEESDSALAVRDTNIATNAANIDWLMTAVDGDWKTYMLARAGMTRIQKNIDTVNRAIKEYGEDNTAALPSRLIEDWENIYEYELFAEIRLDVAFWTEYFVALATWEADPAATTEWTVTKNDDGTYSSNCPHYSTVATTPIVNLNVTTMSGAATTVPILANGTNTVVYVPNATRMRYIVGYGKTSNPTVIFGSRVSSSYYILAGGFNFNKPVLFKGTIANNILDSARVFDSKFLAPRATNIAYALNASKVFNRPLVFEKASEFRHLLDGATAFNNPVLLPKGSYGLNAFINTAMSAENISKTLDSLPAYTSGDHTITFVGCPGASELTQDSPSVASAVARGWTVELDVATA